MSWNLPKLPGYTFQDPTRTQFHVPRKFDYVNGFAIARPDSRGIGGVPIDSEGSSYVQTFDTAVYDPSLTYGFAKKPELPVKLPHWVHYEKRVLTFKGFLKEFTGDHLEQYRIRYINLIYYLEDDTMTIVEPHIKNSGLWQGRMIKRGKIQNNNSGDFWNWKDLNVGMNITLFGNIYHISSCDDFTKEFMASQGIELQEDEVVPSDPYLTSLPKTQQHNKSASHASERTKLRHFLEYDGKILIFYALWDDRDSEYGDIRMYQVSYCLSDDTVSVKEINKTHKEINPCPALLKKVKVRKDWNCRKYGSPYLEYVAEDDDEFYKPHDLIVGNTINILGREFFLFDCENSTRSYYKNVYNIDQPERIAVPEPTVRCIPQRDMPPHIGIGDPEDTFMSCLSFHSKPPRKDIIQYNLNVGKFLRYACEMVSVHPENQGRRFTLSYHLADGSLRLDEVLQRNSGMLGGRFSGPARVKIPFTDTYYTPDKFFIGAIITVNRHKFKIIDADLFVYEYMKKNPEKFSSSAIDNIRKHHLVRGNITDHYQDDNTSASNACLDSSNDQVFQGQESLENLNVPDYGAADPSNNLTHEYSQTRPCVSLPPSLQGLGAISDRKSPIPDESLEPEKPIVCVTGLAVPFHKSMEGKPAGYHPETKTQELSSENMSDREASPNVAAGKTGKMVTFADPFGRRAKFNDDDGIRPKYFNY